MALSNDTKNIIKGIGIATIVFGSIYLFSISKKKGNKNSEDALKDATKKEPEVLIEIANPDVMDIAEPKQDAFAHADGEEKKEDEPKFKEPTMPLSDQAEDALRWFVSDNFDVRTFSNASDEEIIMVAKKAGWKGGGLR